MSVTSELERPRREQSTARVGPVNTAVFEGWCGKLYVPMKMLGIQIRIISTGSFCVLMHFYKLALRTQLPTPKGQRGLSDIRGMQGI